MRKKRKPVAAGSVPPAGDVTAKKTPEIGVAIGELLANAGLSRLAPQPAAAKPPALAKHPAPRPLPGAPAVPRAEPLTLAARPRSEFSAGESAALNQAYRGVQPIHRPKRGRVGKPIKAATPRPTAQPEEAAARERISALVAGGQHFIVERDGAWVQGVRAGVSAQLLRRLSSARFAPEASLDLHGLHREDAARKVREFVRAQHRRGARYLLIIVGKGTHSTNGVGVLGDALVEELIGGVVAPLVAAFTSAAAAHGGSGAIAVQLS